MKKRIPRILLTLLAVVMFIIAILAAVEASVRFQPASPAVDPPVDLPTGSPLVTVRLDEGLFTLFAALNAAGYDDENFGLAYHPARAYVRQELSGRSFSGMERLKTQMGFLNSYQFAVWSLHFGPPPDFARLQPGWQQADAPALLFMGMDELLREFYFAMDVPDLWEQVRPAYEAEAALYQQAAGEAVQQALEYTRIAGAPMRQVVVIPNLLDAHYRGYGPQVGDTAYVIVGPTEGGVDVGLIQHEALHSIAGPLVTANLGEVEPEKSRQFYRRLRERLPPGYGSWESALEEHVVRALDCRLSGAACEEYLLAQTEAEGFLLVRPLVEKLAEYEAGSQALDAFMPELLGVLNQVELP